MAALYPLSAMASCTMLAIQPLSPLLSYDMDDCVVCGTTYNGCNRCRNGKMPFSPLHGTNPSNCHPSTTRPHPASCFRLQCYKGRENGATYLHVQLSPCHRWFHFRWQHAHGYFSSSLWCLKYHHKHGRQHRPWKLPQRKSKVHIAYCWTVGGCIPPDKTQREFLPEHQSFGRHKESTHMIMGEGVQLWQHIKNTIVYYGNHHFSPDGGGYMMEIITQWLKFGMQVTVCLQPSSLLFRFGAI